MKLCHRSALGVSLAHATVALAALCLPACGGSEDDGAVGGAGTGGTSGGAQQDVGTLLTSPTTCTEPHTICMTMQVPSTMEGQPAHLNFDLYDEPGPPASLPDGFAGLFTAPSLTPGQQMYFKLSDAGLEGDHFVWVIMYMPGGGYGAPVVGVDYLMRSQPAQVHLDGTPINIAEPVVLGQ